MGAKYPVQIETTSKPRAQYSSADYMELDLPAAPAIMVGDEVVAEGNDIEERRLEAVICHYLGRPEPKKGGIVSRVLKR